MWWTRRQWVSMILTIYAVDLVLFILFHWESVLCDTVHMDFLPFHNVHPKYGQVKLCTPYINIEVRLINYKLINLMIIG